MKDAKGHGSNAHTSGIEKALAPKVYSWSKYRGTHGLMVDGNFADQIGMIIPTKDSSGKTRYQARYNYSGSTGNAREGWALHNSVVGAKKYVESNLARFWEPPVVKK